METGETQKGSGELWLLIKDRKSISLADLLFAFPRFLLWVAIVTIQWRKWLEMQVSSVLLCLPCMSCYICSVGIRPPSSSGFCSRWNASSPTWWAETVYLRQLLCDRSWDTASEHYLFWQIDAPQIKHYFKMVEYRGNLHMYKAGTNICPSTVSLLVAQYFPCCFQSFSLQLLA